MSELEKEMNGKWTIKEILEAVKELNEIQSQGGRLNKGQAASSAITMLPLP